MSQATGPLTAAQDLYLDLLKKSLTGSTVERDTATVRRPSLLRFNQLLRRVGLELVRSRPFDPVALAGGEDFTDEALTMIGLRRLDNIEACMRDVIANNVPGDFIETGVWRGGATIFMRGVLAALGVDDRDVWAADTFEGLPVPSHPADADDRLHTMDFFSVSLERVKENFRRYGLLDQQVRFAPGLFKYTLPKLDGPWAVIRLDGDLYESTFDALTHLYPDLSPGGWVIVDDYGALEKCARAVDDYRRSEGISDPIQRVDNSGICWQRG
jgi:O-methyltransferase